MFAGTFSSAGDGLSLLGAGLRLAGAVFCAGVAIKLMDDHLDRVGDQLGGRATSSRPLGPAAMPYALLSLLIGVLLQPDAAAPLFLGAYATGMVQDGPGPLPTGLPSWLEAGLAVAGAVFAAGWPLAAAAVCLMVFIQAMDDIADAAEDEAAGARNWTKALGPVETHFVAAAALLFAASLSPSMTLVVLLSTAAVEALFRRLAGRAGDDGPQEGDGSAAARPRAPGVLLPGGRDEGGP